MAKIQALFDPLGELVSPEAAWEAAEGGAKDFFSAAADTVKQIAGIEEGPVSKEDLKQTIEIASDKSEGSIANFQTPRTKEDTAAYKERSTKQVNTNQEILAIHRKDQLEASLEQRIIEINSKIGIKNVLYKGIFSESGEIRTDVQADLERANSELNNEQIKAKREDTMAKAKAKNARGPAGTDILGDPENRNMQQPG